MSKSKITTIEELLTERLDIIKSFNNKADETYFNGMVAMLNAMGYEHIVTDGKVKVIPM